jgi:hypothetical protein
MNDSRLADPFGIRAGKLDELLRSVGAEAPIPVSLSGHKAAIDALMIRLGARQMMELTADHRLFGLPISIDNDVAPLDEIRLQMSDGTERTYRVALA